ncbi:hypothetical protein MHYP_G00346930 [Metynnis hypsauchen]
MSEHLGGWSPWKDVGQNEKDICEKVKDEAQKKTGKNFPVFLPLNYRTQIPNAENYEIQVYVGNNQCAVLTVDVAVRGPPQLKKAVLVPLPGAAFGLIGACGTGGET